jgi:homospermidine synthase
MQIQRFVVIGYGSVSQCLIPLLLKHICQPQQITIIDMMDYQKKLTPYIEKGLKFVNLRLTAQNYEHILTTYLKAGDCLIDLSTFLDSISIIKWCAENQVLNINTAINGWDDALDLENDTQNSINHAHHRVNSVIHTFKNKKIPTIILEHGANPGLVSHLVKKALIDMCNYLKEQKKVTSEVFDLIKDNAFPELAKTLGVKVIHISEKDTQISRFPKKSNEFTNTWSVDGLYSESLIASELGWGSHEKLLPLLGHRYEEGNQNCIFLKKSGKNVKVKSWVPNESFIGMVITHGEAISINDYLSIINNQGQVIYCPTVHYAYCPSNHTILSMQELEHRSLELQSEVRIMNDEIIDGQDKLGVLLMGNPHTSWWTGSLLDIHTSRDLIPNQSATTLQVAGAMVAAIDWMIKNPEEGIHYPDTLPWEPIAKFAEPYWGGYHSMATNWHPNNLKVSPFDKSTDTDWLFQNFIVND